MKNDTSKPSCQAQHDATNPKGQAHTMPSPGSPPKPAPMSGVTYHAIDPKSNMGCKPLE